MRVYCPKFWIKILITCGFLFIFIIGGIIILICAKGTSVLDKPIVLIGILLGGSGIYIVNNIEILINDERIESILRLGRNSRKKILLWSEVEELNSGYILFPEGGYLTLKPKVGLPRKNIHIMLNGMSIELVRDILSHLPPDAKIYLYPYLKRKVEGKQVWFYKR